MAHDVLIAGALFPDVPSVQFPDSQQQWHSFTDVSDTTAAAADVASGKQFYDASGTLTQGTASGGGGGAPKMGVLRPDAELWKSWTYDKMAVADEGKTIPAYATTAQSMIASETLETVALDLDSYTYELLIRTLSAPVYNTNTLGSGRFISSDIVGCYEVFYIPSGAMSDHGVSLAADYQNLKSATQQLYFYFSGASSISLYSASNNYGCYAIPQAPTLSAGSLTVKSPACSMKGYGTYYSTTYWNATTDVRYQYVIELYRTPTNNQYFDGYALLSQGIHTIECAQSATGKLT